MENNTPPKRKKKVFFLNTLETRLFDSKADYNIDVQTMFLNLLLTNSSRTTNIYFLAMNARTDLQHYKSKKSFLLVSAIYLLDLLSLSEKV